MSQTPLETPFTHNELQAAENIVRWQQYIFLLIQEGAAPELKAWAQGKLKAAITRLHEMDSTSSPSIESPAPAANTSTQPSASDIPNGLPRNGGDGGDGGDVVPVNTSTSKDGL